MDRTVLITGGTGALGSAVPERFLKDGCRVAVTWVVKEEAEVVREAVGPSECADVAASIAFLGSQEAGQLRGAWLPVYGAA